MAETLSEQQVERFKRLAWPLLPLVLRTARYLTHHDYDAEDLAQETMIKVMRAIESFKDGTDMKAWLLTILRRTHIDRVRAHQHERHDVSLEGEELEATLAQSRDSESGVHDGEWTEPRQLLDRFEDSQVIDALKRLPEEIRWTLMLVDVESMDQVDAAGVMGVPVGTIKSRAHRGRRMLRDLLFELAQDRGWVPRPRKAASPS